MKILFSTVLLIALIMMQTVISYAADPIQKKPSADSRTLQLQDMLVLMLLPYIQKDISPEYSKVLAVPGSPDVYPYFVDVVETRRENGFRGYQLCITIHVHPTVGPHISVGEDMMSYQISAGGVRLVHYKHLRGPRAADFPPNYQYLLR